MKTIEIVTTSGRKKDIVVKTGKEYANVIKLLEKIKLVDPTKDKLTNIEMGNEVVSDLYSTEPVFHGMEKIRYSENE